jgi:hypothetical protein
MLSLAQLHGTGLEAPTSKMARSTHMKIEPKTFFANERECFVQQALRWPC